MDEPSWSAALLAESVEGGGYRAVLVVSLRENGVVSDVVIPLDGTYDSRLAVEEVGKDVLASMVVGE